MYVLGTAGHVDHGKSTLIAALTGVHPDRLKEEQERQMTIDLGFGWLKLPDGEEIGIVDVPGHRDFIENMLAGVGGLDAVLLVIAADEGVMPQTREHLAILDLLNIPRGLIVLNKIDLVADEEWLALVEEEIRSLTRGTILQNAPIVRVSARRGDGMAMLLKAIQQLLEGLPPRPDLGRPRLPIDRVFTLTGFGTIVTGTLLDGSFRLGDEVVILPANLPARIRGLQTHKKSEEIALPGRRTAINLAGLSVHELKRGDVVTLPGQYQSTTRLDVTIRLLADLRKPLRHGMQVKIFHGTAESMALVRLLGRNELLPGEQGLAQLELSHPFVAVRGDRLILRRPSPPETLGGGIVLDPHPVHRHRRFDPLIQERLQALQQGRPSDILLQASLELSIASLQEIARRAALDENTIVQTAQELIESRDWLVLQETDGDQALDRLIIATARWNTLTEQALSQIAAYHRLYPLRPGMPRQELIQRLHLSPAHFGILLERWLAKGLLKENQGRLALPEHEIRFTPAQEDQIQALFRRFSQQPYAPPTIPECIQSLGEEVFQALLTRGDLVAISAEIVFRRSDFEQMVERLRQALCREGHLTVAQVRDLFQSSRKYILPFLEYLDARGLTRREGDFRYWNQPCVDDSR
uniref:Selenocysteine-specific elongation factor n=1 Tax=uncultured Chloroflexota bacterium TaxID=166587 RepID=H5SFP6_9CHLR|nr:selenocysteine-specific translation elongation factor [uncultured Chloroflexota bacterium]